MDINHLSQTETSENIAFLNFKDHPVQLRSDLVHKNDELFVLAEGEIEIEICFYPC